MGLTREKEAELFGRWHKRKDRAARDALILSCKPYVDYWAMHYSRKASWLRDDLAQQGYIGVMRAIDKFDSARGLRLGTYARWWIRATMLRYLMQNKRPLPLPSGRFDRRAFFRVAPATSALRQELGRMPTHEEIAERIDAPVQFVTRTIEYITCGDVSTESVLARKIPDAIESPEELAARSEEVELVCKLLEELDNPRDRRVIEMVFFEDKTLKEAGEELGFGRERARQLRERALERMAKAV